MRLVLGAPLNKLEPNLPENIINSPGVNTLVALSWLIKTSDLQYISIQQYINTVNKYHDMIMHLVNIWGSLSPWE